MRKLLALVLIPLCIAGCGGGGGGSSSGGGGGGGGGGTTPPTAGPPNVESVVLDAGPSQLTVPAINTAFVSVKVCIPGTTTCQTIDHVEVDTGSVGLRIIAGGNEGNGGGELTIALPAVMDASNNALAECLQFGDGFSWGSVATADITMPVSMETASNVVVQIIGATSAGDPSSASPGCVPFAPLVTENTVTSFGANGIIGVGPFLADCNAGTQCVPGTPQCNTASPPQCVPQFSATYYKCPTPTACSETTVNANQQLQNPASLFAKDNNGVIMELPAVGDSGANNPSGGVLVFGIGTESNNGLGSATEVPINATTGYVSATLNGASLSDSYIDSGSNGNFFVSSSLPACGAPNTPNAGFYCPSSTTSQNATFGGLAADFDVANANTLFQSNNTAFNNVAGTIADPLSLDLGLPFFFGRSIYTAWSPQPYFAF